MSLKYPIIAITGSSGAGSPVVTSAIEDVLGRVNSRYFIVDGEGFHRYDRYEFPSVVSKAAAEGRTISHFSPAANLLDMLESLMREFAEKGRGMHRRYVHDEVDAEETGCQEGTFTPWESVPENIDILVYEGLHGAFVSESVDIAGCADLKIGVVPIVNLEWMQKIHRDTRLRGYSAEAVTVTLERRMSDYVNYITPQFARTDINFQRIPMVDTANPFDDRDPPTLNESKVVVHFRNRKKIPCTFPPLLEKIPGSFLSRSNNMVIPGSELDLALQLILEPLVEDMLGRRSLGAC